MKVMWNIAVNRFRQSLAAISGVRFLDGAHKLSMAALPLCAAAVFSVAVSSCGNYDPLPPKTEAATSYYIPAPETPTQDEIDEMKAERDEYSKLTK